MRVINAFLRICVVLVLMATLSGCFLFGAPELVVTGPLTEGGADVTLTSGDTIDWPNTVTVLGDPAGVSVTVTITNAGTAPLEFTESGPNYISATSTPADLFTVSDQPQPALAPADTHAFLLTLNPDSATATVTGTVTIVTNDPDTPSFTLSLTGDVANS